MTNARHPELVAPTWVVNQESFLEIDALGVERASQ